MAILIPYMAPLADVARGGYEDRDRQSGGGRPYSEHARPGTSRTLREVSYGPPKIDRPEPRVIMRVVETPIEMAQDQSHVQFQPTPTNSLNSPLDGQEPQQGNTSLACQTVKGKTWCFNGSASANSSTGVITLTPAENTRGGSAWNEDPIDLSQDITFSFMVFLGEHDYGADGIAFVLQSESLTALKAQGGSLGYGNPGMTGPGIQPSIEIEMDTYENIGAEDTYDPTPNDHLMLAEDGDENYFNYTNTPFYNFGNKNIEDGREHWLLVKWEASSQTLQVYWDGTRRLVYQKDLVGEIFDNDPMVWYGFTGATFAFNNLQYFYEGVPLYYLTGSSSGDPCFNGSAGDYAYYPINTLTGGLDYSTTDLSFQTVAGSLAFERFYDSMTTGLTGTWSAPIPYTTTLGYGWTHNHAASLQFTGNLIEGAPDGTTQVVLFKAHTTNQYVFFEMADGSYVPYPGLCASLVYDSNTEQYTLTDKAQRVYIFDDEGKLLQWADAQGHAFTYTYETADGKDRLAEVADPSGLRYLKFFYDDANDLPERLIRVTDHISREVLFGYDLSTGNLITVTDVLGHDWTYQYTSAPGSPDPPRLLSAVLDPQGRYLERTEYDAEGRAVRQYLGPDESDLIGELVYTYTQGMTTTHVIEIVDSQIYSRTVTFDLLNTARDKTDAYRKDYDNNFHPAWQRDPNELE
jgi:hypothetical protein